MQQTIYKYIVGGTPMRRSRYFVRIGQFRCMEFGKFASYSMREHFQFEI